MVAAWILPAPAGRRQTEWAGRASQEKAMEFRFTTPGDREGLKDLSTGLDAVLRRNGLDQALIDDIQLITEEIVANAIDHGFIETAPAGRQVTVSLRADGTRLHMEFRDNGRPFNPLEAPPPDLDADILDRPIGGLGIHLVRELSEQVYYRREDGQNILGCTLSRHPPLDGDSE
jgi:serine/threonine-protein kinase RsbW